MRNLLILTVCALVACQDVGHLTPRDDPNGFGDTDVGATCRPHVLDQRVHLATSDLYGAVWTTSGGGRAWGGVDRTDDVSPTFRVPNGWPDIDPGEWRDVSAAACLCVVDPNGDLHCLWGEGDWLPDTLPRVGLAGVSVASKDGCVLAASGDISCHRAEVAGAAPAADLLLPGSWSDVAFMMEEFDPRHYYGISVLALDAQGHIGAAGAITDEKVPDVDCANELVTEPNAAVCWTDADDRIGCLLRYPDGLDDFFNARYAVADQWSPEVRHTT